jgi:hypothetical protein
MEYEMEAESGLFDASTNPSLERRAARPVRDRRLQERRRPQRAEVIPEEDEDQAA